MRHVIQLVNGFVILVDDDVFDATRKKFLGKFHFNDHLDIVDTRGHKFTVSKSNILLFERYNEEVKTQEDCERDA